VSKSDPLSLAAKVLHEPKLATGGFSGECFSGTWFRERAFIRLYLNSPRQAVLDLAVMRRLSGVVPLPKILAAEPRGVGSLPPHIVTARVDGKRADHLLDRGLPLPASNALGRQCARLVTRLRAVRCEGHGPFVDADLRVGQWPPYQADLVAWYGHLEAGLAAAGLGRRSTPGLRAAVEAAAQRLAMGPSRPSSLVHGDLNGKNLIVDPNTGRLRAVLDWEFAHAGEWTEDVGNLLRAGDHGAGSGEIGAASWSAFRRGLVDALHTGIYEDGTMISAGLGGLDDDWLQRAADMDMYSLLELAARPERGASAPAPITVARTALRGLAAVRGRR
jgi:hypothetical protein